MTKQLIIGLATLSVAGAAIIGSGLHAATTGSESTTQTSVNVSTHRGGNIGSGTIHDHNIANMKAMSGILSGVSDIDKAAIETIRTEYRTKMEALHTEEKAKIDAIIAKYPELKAKLDTLEANRPAKSQVRGAKHGGRGMMKNTNKASTTPTAQ